MKLLAVMACRGGGAALSDPFPNIPISPSGSGSINFTWTPEGTADGTLIYLFLAEPQWADLDLSPPDARYKAVGESTGSLVIQNLVVGTTYYIKIARYSGSQVIGLSNYVTRTAA